VRGRAATGAAQQEGEGEPANERGKQSAGLNIAYESGILQRVQVHRAGTRGDLAFDGTKLDGSIDILYLSIWSKGDLPPLVFVFWMRQGIHIRAGLR
jgi:hypothetical protein